jgi:hypothetical protein
MLMQTMVDESVCTITSSNGLPLNLQQNPNRPPSHSTIPGGGKPPKCSPSPLSKAAGLALGLNLALFGWRTDSSFAFTWGGEVDI